MVPRESGSVDCLNSSCSLDYLLYTIILKILGGLNVAKNVSL